MVSMKKVLERAGAEVDLERAIPALYRMDAGGKVTEAILDAVIIPPGCPSSTLVNVTIRCPHAQRTNSKASVTPSIAAAEGERDKLNRYGRSVLPLAFETYGRLGQKSLQTVSTLSNQVVAATVASRFHRGSDFIAALRLDLERSLLWCIADVTLLSIGHVCQLGPCQNRCRVFGG